MEEHPKTSRQHAIDLLAEHADRAPVAAAQAFAMLAVADELTATRVGFGGAAQAVAPVITQALADVVGTSKAGAPILLATLTRIADALEHLMASGRLPVDATLRTAPDERLAGPAGT